MKIITYLNAMESADRKYGILCRYLENDPRVNKLRDKYCRKYWKFRERLLQRIERLEQFQKDYAIIVAAHSGDIILNKQPLETVEYI